MNRLASNYLSGMEERLNRPTITYSSRAIIFDFSMSLALAFAIGFALLVL